MHLITGQGAKIPHDTEQPSLWPTVTEPARSAAHMPQLESPCTTTKDSTWHNEDPAKLRLDAA